jgi:hypothetical protein
VSRYDEDARFRCTRVPFVRVSVVGASKMKWRGDGRERVPTRQNIMVVIRLRPQLIGYGMMVVVLVEVPDGQTTRRGGERCSVLMSSIRARGMMVRKPDPHTRLQSSQSSPRLPRGLTEGSSALEELDGGRCCNVERSTLKGQGLMGRNRRRRAE